MKMLYIKTFAILKIQFLSFICLQFQREIKIVQICLKRKLTSSNTGVGKEACESI